MKRLFTLLLIGALSTCLMTGCGQTLADVGTDSFYESREQSKENAPSSSEAEENQEVLTSYTVPANAFRIQLSDTGCTLDDQPLSTEPDSRVYAANDIVFYEEGQGFTYGEGTAADEHSRAEADTHTVIHITQPGDYAIEGKLSAGQIAVDLGDGAKEDPEAVVNLYLNGLDITCSVAPGVIFYNVYECGSTDTETATYKVDTKDAGANVFICDDTVNTVNGSYVARIYKSYELNEEGTEVIDNKKLHKYDGAFYSKRSINIYGGNGTLNINAENEGLDSELHLTVNGGNINIVSGNDGINTNEDEVSVTTVNGGNLNILVSGTTGEGDGIDSNGWLVINGGTVTAAACGHSGDAGIDSDMGIHVNGGTLMASGNMYDRLETDSKNYAVFSFASRQKGGTTYTFKNDKEQIVYEWTPANDHIYLVVADPKLTEGIYTLWCGNEQMTAVTDGGTGGFGGGHPPKDGDFDPDNMPEGMTPPDFEKPSRPEGSDDENRPRPEDFGKGKGPRPESFDDENKLPPEGFEGDKGPRPEAFGGSGDTKEASTDFVIQKGGNFFNRITKVSTDI